VLYPTLISMFEDPSLLVQYFATIAFGRLLSRLERKDFLMPFLEFILENFVRLSVEFDDYEFMSFIATFVGFFGDLIFEFAPVIVPEIFSIYASYVMCSDLGLATGIILSELFQFLQSFVKSQFESMTVIAQLVGSVTELIGHCPLPITGSLLEFVSNLVVISPSPSQLFWDFAQIVPEFGDEQIDDSCLFLRNLVLRDPEAARSPETANQLRQFAMSLIHERLDVPDPSIYSAFLLIHVLIESEVINDLNSIASTVLPIALDCLRFQDSWGSISSLFLSLLLHAFAVLEAMLGDRFTKFLRKWVRISESTDLMVFVLNFPEQEPAEDVQNLIGAVWNKLENENDDSFDDAGARVMPALALHCHNKADVRARFHARFPVDD
jgi:hypothetical protein